MMSLRSYRTGLITGLLFGTAGVFLLAVLSLVHPVFATIAAPFLWPGRWMASFIATGQTMSSWTVLILYVLSGVFYAIVGAAVQKLILTVRR